MPQTQSALPPVLLRTAALDSLYAEHGKDLKDVVTGEELEEMIQERIDRILRRRGEMELAA